MSLTPAARRRADERRRRPCALLCERRSGWRWRRSASGRDPADRPRSAPWRSSTGRSPTGGCRRCDCRLKAGSAAAAASPSAPAARWSASITSKWVRIAARARPACRSARSARRSSQSGPGGRRPHCGAAQRPGAQRPPRQLAAPSCGTQRPDHRHDRFGFNRPRACGSASPHRPIMFDAARLNGSFAGRGLRGDFGGAQGDHRQCPAAAERRRGDAGGSARATSTSSSALTVSDRDADPRFYPLRSDDVHFTLAGDYVRATGTLRHPASGALVTDVSIEHRLSTGAGHATFDVPGLSLRAQFPARRTHPPDRGRRRAGQRHDQRPRPDRLDRERQGHFDRRLLDDKPRSWRRRSAR